MKRYFNTFRETGRKLGPYASAILVLSFALMIAFGMKLHALHIQPMVLLMFVLTYAAIHLFLTYAVQFYNVWSFLVVRDRVNAYFKEIGAHDCEAIVTVGDRDQDHY